MREKRWYNIGTMAARKKTPPTTESATTQPNLDNIYKIFLRWYVVPPSIRQTAGFKSITLEDFCAEHSITTADLSSFQAKPTFEDDFFQEKLRWARRKTPELIDTLYKQYRDKKNPADLKLWVELTNTMLTVKDTNSDEVDAPYVLDTTDEQKKQILERAFKRYHLTPRP